jgi:hypothetical protein
VSKQRPAAANPWQAPLLRAIVMRDGTRLDTLHEARAYIIALPEDRHSPQWNAAVARLLEASQSGSAQDIHRAMLAVELAFLFEGKLNQNG